MKDLLLFGGGSRTSPSSTRKAYSLYDTFATDRAAGAVNGTLAEPVGGARTVVDTNSKISIAGGVAVFATGAAAQNGIWWPAQARVLGKTALFYVVPSAATNQISCGTSNVNSSLITNRFSLTNAGAIGCAGVITGAYTATPYNIALVVRTAGHFYFVKGGAFTNWTLLWMSVSSEASQYPGIQYNGTSTAFTADNPRIPKSLYIPVPLQSDGMSAATTDGLGNAEANGTAGNAYTNIGTWGVAAGVRSCSVLGGGGAGFSVLSTNTRDVVIDASLTRSAGRVGIIARYQDSSNYIHCSHDGTNVLVIQVVAGTPTTLSTTAVAYSAGAVMRFVAEGLTYRAFYNNTVAGSGALPDTANTNHGLVTNNIGNSFDNLVIWARSGYEGLSLL